VNDQYGHDIGDQALIGFTHTLKKYLNNTECKFARFGGEEFLVVMPGYDVANATVLITGLCDFIRESTYTDLNISITSSAGVSQYIKGIQLNAILKQADQKLYEAKNTGRDKVCG
jgi:diguanylate cyclase (GGDEF)-like protein